MNDRKLKKLFDAARNETPPVPPEDFDARVMSAVRREPSAAPFSLWEQLDRLFPRLAVAAVTVIALCLLADYCYPSSLTEDVNAVAQQWLLADNGD